MDWILEFLFSFSGRRNSYEIGWKLVLFEHRFPEIFRCYFKFLFYSCINHILKYMSFCGYYRLIKDLTYWTDIRTCMIAQVGAMVNHIRLRFLMKMEGQFYGICFYLVKCITFCAHRSKWNFPINSFLVCLWFISYLQIWIFCSYILVKPFIRLNCSFMHY